MLYKYINYIIYYLKYFYSVQNVHNTNVCIKFGIMENIYVFSYLTFIIYNSNYQYVLYAVAPNVDLTMFDRFSHVE